MIGKNTTLVGGAQLASIEGVSNDVLDNVLTVSEFAMWARFHPATIRDWIERGVLPHRRLASVIVIPLDPVLTILEG